ncbi:MAG: protein-L-isoaspartate(D-aspartate) O-methyltransferase [Bacteroidota bacterium]|nr:protein-L-isoaspartate(D-aspartate) O-methyltransferase [Bacteroidota bacterium]
MEDSFKDKGMRKRLVDDIRRKGISDEAVLEAMNRVPRHSFMDSGFIRFAYRDNAFPIGAGQTISQPYTVAFQTQLLEVKEFHKVLEIGTGSGYQTAVLLELGATVYSIERYKELHQKSNDLLDKLGYHPHLFWGDGYLGKETYAPFDSILLTAGAPIIPETLKNQLKIGGCIVAPVGGDGSQVMTRLWRISETKFETETFGYFSFVPFLKGKA